MKADLFAVEALQSKTFKEFWKEVRNMNSSTDAVDHGCTVSFSEARHQIFRANLNHSNTTVIHNKYFYPVTIVNSLVVTVFHIHN